MVLNSRHLVRGGPKTMVCVHGVAHHGGAFRPFAERLEIAHDVVGVDLRGHGASGREPPWDTETHAADLVETLDGLELGAVTLVGHSFGARVAAAVAARSPERVQELVLLDPALEIPGAYALASAEIDRLDWTFASVDSAVSALMSAKTVVDLPRETVVDFAEADLAPGPDGRLRFSHSAAATVVSWSEMTRPAPPVADVRTLIVRPVGSHLDPRPFDSRYRAELGSRLSIAAVPKGHNVLWEAPAETASVVGDFVR